MQNRCWKGEKERAVWSTARRKLFTEWNADKLEETIAGSFMRRVKRSGRLTSRLSGEKLERVALENNDNNNDILVITDSSWGRGDVRLHKEKVT